MLQVFNGISFRHKNEKVLPFVTMWMDPEGIMLSEIGQIEKEKYCTVSLICVNLLKKKQQTTKN